MFDFFFLLYILFNAFLGFRYGLFRRFLHVGSFYLGLLLAQAVSPGLSQQFGFSTGAHPAAAHFGVFLIVVLIVVGVIEVLGFAYRKELEFLNALVFDRFFGLAVGLVASALELTILLYLFANLVSTTGPGGTSAQPAIVTTASAQLSASPTAGQLHRLQSIAIIAYRPVLPDEPGRYFAKTYS